MIGQYKCCSTNLELEEFHQCNSILTGTRLPTQATCSQPFFSPQSPLVHKNYFSNALSHEIVPLSSFSSLSSSTSFSPSKVNSNTRVPKSTVLSPNNRNSSTPLPNPTPSLIYPLAAVPSQIPVKHVPATSLPLPSSSRFFNVNSPPSPISTTSLTSSSPLNSYSLSDFQILSTESLGHGAFGNVYEARSHLPEFKDKPIALKFINHEQLTQKYRERIRMEIELHKQMSLHPSILTFYTSFEMHEGMYLVLEHCPHGDLHKFLKLHGHFTEAQVRWLLLQLVPGFDFLHKNNIMHRDIKLSNILLTKTYQVKLADFGLATLNQGEHHTLCGTPNYLAPEMIQTGSSHGPAVDVWALGCLVYALFTGHPPFDHLEVQVTLAQIVQTKNQPIQFTPLTSTHSKLAVQLLSELMKVDPTQRPSFHQILAHPFLNSSLPTHALTPDPLSTLRISRGTYSLMNQTLRIHTQGHVSQKVPEQLDFVISEDGIHCQIGEHMHTYPNLPPVLLCRYIQVYQGLQTVRNSIPKVTVYVPNAKAVWMESQEFHFECLNQPIRLVHVHDQVHLYHHQQKIGSPFSIYQTTFPSILPRGVWLWFKTTWHLCLTLDHTHTSFPITFQWPSLFPVTSVSPKITTPSMVSSSPKAVSFRPASFQPFIYTVYIKGIGFCSKYSHVFRVYFEDSSVLEMQSVPSTSSSTSSSGSSISFQFGHSQNNGHIIMKAYRLDQPITSSLKKKLGQFAQCVQLMKQNGILQSNQAKQT
ncbi:Serine/threonine-protein kinase plk4 [Coelomomyces lativittatus]|nr:Serine/threonine-protein kinase plk4 [Coelomomyces lativittatus]KAJ1516699.1 Serine/threonine-protein kinase plk4 [Coelomomyces lativittatus]KAJ1517464.1 Serine/threonine-protein kinase plk4 [Coelomomyces lativittatus]